MKYVTRVSKEIRCCASYFTKSVGWTKLISKWDFKPEENHIQHFNARCLLHCFSKCSFPNVTDFGTFVYNWGRTLNLCYVLIINQLMLIAESVLNCSKCSWYPDAGFSDFDLGSLRKTAVFTLNDRYIWHSTAQSSFPCEPGKGGTTGRCTETFCFSTSLDFLL